MNTVSQSSLTILFEAPFWIGLYERSDNGKYEVCKITFGAEPKDYEVYEFLLKNWKGKPKVASSERQKKIDNMLCGRKKRKQNIADGNAKRTYMRHLRVINKANAEPINW